MAILTKPSFAPGTALIYSNVGALMDVWTGVYYYTIGPDRSSEGFHVSSFWLAGFFLTGLILMAIGFALGPIGRSARQAEMPPAEVTPQAAQAEVNAAAHAPIPPSAIPVARTATRL